MFCFNGAIEHSLLGRCNLVYSQETLYFFICVYEAIYVQVC